MSKAAVIKHFVKSTLEAYSLFKISLYDIILALTVHAQHLEKKKSPKRMKKVETALQKM